MSDAVENLDTRELGFSDTEDEPEEVDSEFNPSGEWLLLLFQTHIIHLDVWMWISFFLWVIGDNTRRLVDYGLFVCHWIVFDCWSIEVGCHFFCPGMLLATIDCKNFLVGYFVF